MSRLTIGCPKCKADQPDLRPRSQVVVCWKCGAMARLSVDWVRDTMKVTITPVDRPVTSRGNRGECA